MSDIKVRVCVGDSVTVFQADSITSGKVLMLSLQLMTNVYAIELYNGDQLIDTWANWPAVNPDTETDEKHWLEDVAIALNKRYNYEMSVARKLIQRHTKRLREIKSSDVEADRAGELLMQELWAQVADATDFSDDR